MRFQYIEQAYPGYTEESKQVEYEKIKNKINTKYNVDFTAFSVRAEFEKVYNKLFETLLQDHSNKIFDILYVFMDCFNINEVKAVRYLNKQNKELVRNYALCNYNTKYYENIEQQKIDAKLEKKGKKSHKHSNINNLFE